MCHSRRVNVVLFSLAHVGSGMLGACNSGTQAVTSDVGADGGGTADVGDTTGDGDGDGDTVPNDDVPIDCGDGSLDDGEECDLGVLNSDNGACTSRCQLAVCGDGLRWLDEEACDDGNDDNHDACLVGCEAASCGDGYTQAGTEECDPSDPASDPFCTMDCMVGDGGYGSCTAESGCPDTSTCTAMRTDGDSLSHAPCANASAACWCAPPCVEHADCPSPTFGDSAGTCIDGLCGLLCGQGSPPSGTCPPGMECTYAYSPLANLRINACQWP